MTTAPKRLRDLIVEEISLVDEPANPGARVLLWKRKDDAAMNPAEKKSLLVKIGRALGIGGEIEGDIRATGGDPDVTDLEKKLDDLTKKYTQLERDKALCDVLLKIQGAQDEATLKLVEIDVAKLAPEHAKSATDALARQRASQAEAAKLAEKSAGYAAFRAKLPKALQKAFDDLDEDEKAKFMSRYGKTDPDEMLNGPMAKALEKTTERADRLETEVAALREESALRKLMSGDLKALGSGEAAESTARAVLKLRALNRDAADQLTKQLVAQAAQLQTAGLFKVLGQDGGAPISAEAKLEALAKARALKDNSTFEKAYSAVLQENPELYVATLDKNRE